MTYKAVMFDLDGTLVQTLPEYLYLIVGRTLRDLGVTSWTERDIDRFWFETDRDEIVRQCFCPDIMRFWEAYTCQDTVERRSKLTRVYPDVDIIPELRRRGYKTGIVTGAPQEILELELGMIGADNFDAVVRAQPGSGVRKKPDPEGIERCLAQLGASREAAMYVGNGAEDVAAARNASVLDVLVLRGEYWFEGLDASVKVNDLYGLRKVLGI